MVHLALLLVLAAGPAAPPAVGASLPLPGGTVLRQLASPVAPPVVVVRETSQGEVLELHEGWVRVRWGTTTGWVAPGGGAAPQPAGGERTAPPLEVARRRLGPDARETRLGPFELLTDVRDEALIDRLRTIARQLPPLFAERYGLGPDAPPTGSATPTDWIVVLFAEAADYDAVDAHVSRVTGRPPAAGDYVGHAVGRLAYLTAVEEVERLFLHEAAHLLVRRHLRDDPPVWLDEGIAGDVEMIPMDAEGRLLSEVRLDRGSLPRRLLYHRSGPLARLDDLAEAARRRRLPGVSSLLDLQPRELDHPLERRTAYAFAALLVRYLVEGGGGELADRFRGFLAAGGDAALLDSLGMDKGALEYGFADWLVRVETRLAVGVR